MEESNFKGKSKDKRYPIYPGMRVFVYRNLNVNHLPEGLRTPVIYSIQARETISAPGFDTLRYGTVFHHAPEVTLTDCELKVSAGTGETPYGWKGVRRFGVKNVHAGVCGSLFDWDETQAFAGIRLSYNPHRNRAFVTDHGGVVYDAQAVRCASVLEGLVHRSLITAVDENRFPEFSFRQ